MVNASKTEDEVKKEQDDHANEEENFDDKELLCCLLELRSERRSTRSLSLSG